jgi:hypothetical protein
LRVQKSRLVGEALIQYRRPKMSDLREEFGFIPPELLYKCDSFVRAFHDARGSGKNVVAASAMFSAESPYLTDLIRIIVRQGKIIKILGVVVVMTVIISILSKLRWLLVVIVPAGAAMLHVSRVMKFNLVQQRAIILAVEALATDFAGWGQLFPVARAEAMYVRDAGDWPKLVELYLPSIPDLTEDSQDRWVLR